MNMKKQTILFSMLSLLSLQVFIFSSCKEEELPEEPNEEELITTLILEFENTISGEVHTFEFRDTDGPGGSEPVDFDTIRLDDNSSYHITVSLLNESVSPADDITVEVVEEGVDHQLFYVTSGGLNLFISYDDEDANGDPIGLHAMAATTDASTGTTTVTLKHQPDIKDGNILTGDTDVEVIFVTKVE